MIKLMNFMSKHKVFMFVIPILIFAVPLVIVNLLYKMDCKIIWLQSEWSAGDILAYIAGVEAFIGTVFLGFLAWWQNHQIQEQYIESQEPLLSMNLINENSILYLCIENTGGVEAEDISIKVLDIYNNGQNNELYLDGLFKTTFELYPKETVKGMIAISGENITTEIFPKIRLRISYIRSDLKRKKEYERTVIYNGALSQNISMNIKNDLHNIANDVDNIARANVRMANYLDGHQIIKMDKLNILTDRSLRNDLVEAIKTKQKTPIFDREQVIDKNLQNEPQKEK